jgi:hypothetical protein
MGAAGVNDRWNPFSWRAEELAALGEAPEHRARREQLLTEVALAEADEASRGAKHLSVAHDVPTTSDEYAHLQQFYDIAREMAAAVGWYRLRGADSHLIIAVAGPSAEECITRVAGVAASMNPGHWRITWTACPELA